MVPGDPIKFDGNAAPTLVGNLPCMAGQPNRWKPDWWNLCCTLVAIQNPFSSTEVRSWPILHHKKNQAQVAPGLETLL